MADVRLARLVVDWVGRNQDFIRASRRNAQALRAQRRRIQRLNREAREFNQTADRMVRRLSLVAGIAGGYAARSFAQFEQSMAKVRGITNATDRQFQYLEKTALRLGRTTRFSAGQVAEGSLFLARAGQNPRQIEQTLPGALRLAQGADVEVGVAADIVTNQLAAFRENVDQTTRFVDVLTAATNSANTDLIQLADAMKFAAPAARAFGLDIETTAAAVGVLSNAGLQGTLAGTGLRRVMVGLAAPTKQASDILARYGFTLQDVSVRQHGLIPVIDRLARAGLSAGEAFQIFGQRGFGAFDVLSGRVDQLRQLTAQFGDVAGVSQRLADIMDDTLTGAFFRAISAAEGFSIQLLRVTGAADAIRSGLEGTANILNNFTDGLADSADVVVLTGKILFAALAVSRFRAVSLSADQVNASLNSIRFHGVNRLRRRIGIVATGFVLARRSVRGFGGALRSIDARAAFRATRYRILARGIDAVSRSARIATGALRTLRRATVVFAVAEGLIALGKFFINLNRNIKALGITFKDVAVTAGLDLVEGILRALLALPRLLGRAIAAIGRGIATAFRKIGSTIFDAFFSGIAAGEAASREGAADPRSFSPSARFIDRRRAREGRTRTRTRTPRLTPTDIRMETNLAGEEFEVGLRGLEKTISDGITNLSTSLRKSFGLSDSDTAKARQAYRDAANKALADLLGIFGGGADSGDDGAGRAFSTRAFGLSQDVFQDQAAGIGNATNQVEIYLRQLRKIDDVLNNVRRSARETGLSDLELAQLQLDRFVIDNQRELGKLTALQIERLNERLAIIRDKLPAAYANLRQAQEGAAARDLFENFEGRLGAAAEIQRIRERTAAIGKTASELKVLELRRRVDNLLSAEGAALTDKQRQILREYAATIEGPLTEALAEFDRKSRLQEAVEGITRSLETFTSKAITNFREIGDAARNLAADIIQNLQKALIFDPLRNAAVGFIRSGISSLFGGGGAPVGGPRQQGGPVSPGRVYTVGEAGVELFSPSTNGNIISNASLNAARMGQQLANGGIVINFAPTIQSMDGPGVLRVLNEVLPSLAEVVKSEVGTDAGRPSRLSDQIRTRR